MNRGIHDLHEDFHDAMSEAQDARYAIEDAEVHGRPAAEIDEWIRARDAAIARRDEVQRHLTRAIAEAESDGREITL